MRNNFPNLDGEEDDYPVPQRRSGGRNLPHNGPAQYLLRGGVDRVTNVTSHKHSDSFLWLIVILMLLVVVGPWLTMTAPVARIFQDGAERQIRTYKPHPPNSIGE